MHPEIREKDALRVVVNAIIAVIKFVFVHLPLLLTYPEGSNALI